MSLNIEPVLLHRGGHVTCALYLALISFLTGGGGWYAYLALPLTFIWGGAAMLSVYVCGGPGWRAGQGVAGGAHRRGGAAGLER